MVEHLRLTDPHGRPIVVAREHELAARRGHREVGRRPRRLRTRPAERRDRHGHEPRVVRQQPVEVDRHGTALDEHVSRPAEGVEVDRIERDGPLAAVVRQMPEASFQPGFVADERAGAAHRRSLRRLDQDHIGAELAEQEPGQMATVVGQIEHSVR